MKVCYILDNVYSNDTRIIKQGAELRKHGFNVDVVCYWREGYPPNLSVEHGVNVIRTQKGVRPNTSRLIKGLLQPVKKGIRYFFNIPKKLLVEDDSSEKLPRVEQSWLNDKKLVLKKLIKSVIVELPKLFVKLIGFLFNIIFKKLGLAKFFALLFVSLMRLLVGKHNQFDLDSAVAEQSSYRLSMKIILSLKLVGFIFCSPLLVMFMYTYKKCFPFPEQLSPEFKYYCRDIKVVINAMFSRSFLVMLLTGISRKADIYQANDPPTLMIAYLCAKWHKSHFVYDSHELYDESFPKRLPQLFRFCIRLYEGFFVRRADCVVTVNQSIADILYQRYRPKQFPLILRNTQPVHEYAKINAHLRTKYDIQDDQLIAIYAGRITFGRGIEAVLQALSALNNQVVLVLMGDYDLSFKEIVYPLIEKQEGTVRVIYIPSVPSEEIGQYVAQADVGLMLTDNLTLSYYYGLGNKLFHYVINGLPVLVPDQPEKKKVVEKYQVGWCTRSLSSQAITEQFQYILANRAEVEAKKAACLNARSELDWDKEVQGYAQTYLNLYEQVLFDNRRIVRQVKS